MEGKLAITRRFFKVMMPGFQQKLNLPPAYCEKLQDEKSEWATLKSCKGTWGINVCRNHEGLICFKDGWPQFVYHHGLTIGDFVVFEHTAELHFNVFVFDSTACEKDFLVKPKKEHEETTEAVNPGYHHPQITRRESNKEFDCQNPYFVLTMKPCHARVRGQVTIPTEFVRSNNLVRKTSATLRDPRRRVWPVKLRGRRDRRLHLSMGEGWHDFRVSNELKNGDVCVFNLNRHSLRSTTILFDAQIFPAPTQDIDPFSSN